VASNPIDLLAKQVLRQFRQCRTELRSIAQRRQRAQSILPVGAQGDQ
jgi:hypothetical protein